MNDKHNYTLFKTFSEQKENVHVAYEGNPIIQNFNDKIYINVKPPKNDDICFIDSWGMSDEIPQAHIVSKNDSKQKLRIICEVLHL